MWRIRGINRLWPTGCDSSWNRGTTASTFVRSPNLGSIYVDWYGDDDEGFISGEWYSECVEYVPEDLPQLDGIRPCIWLLSKGLFKEKLRMLRTTSFSISTCAPCITNPIMTTAITPYQRSPRWVSLSTNLANHCQSLTAYEDMAFFTYLLTLSVRWAHNAIASHSSLVLSLWLLLLDLEYSCALDRTHVLMSSVLIRLYWVCWTCSHSLLNTMSHVVH